MSFCDQPFCPHHYASAAAVRATAEEAQTTVDESAAQYQTLIREQVDFHANYVPAFDNDPAFAAAPAPSYRIVVTSAVRARGARARLSTRRRRSPRLPVAFQLGAGRELVGSW